MFTFPHKRTDKIRIYGHIAELGLIVINPQLSSNNLIKNILFAAY